MWGIIPAAGSGSRIQPLAFSKELLPVGSGIEEGVERPRAVSEYLVERMVVAGARKLCFVISPAKTDILHYYGGHVSGADVVYAVQPAPGGLCDAVFRAAPLVPFDEPVLIGLPDTIWFPRDALVHLPADTLSLLLFPVEQPELFDAVSTDDDGNLRQIHVKEKGAPTHWIWGALKMPGRTFHELHELWRRPLRRDEYFGSLINAWLADGGRATGIRAGQRYVDTGTLNGYRSAMRLLDDASQPVVSTPRQEENFAHELTSASRH